MLAAVILLCANHCASGALYTDNVATQEKMWESFKLKFEKSYSSAAEEAQKFAIFVNNLKLADEHHENAAGSSSHGITIFMDQNFVSVLLCQFGFLAVILCIYRPNLPSQ